MRRIALLAAIGWTLIASRPTAADPLIKHEGSTDPQNATPMAWTKVSGDGSVATGPAGGAWKIDDTGSTGDDWLYYKFDLDPATMNLSRRRAGHSRLRCSSATRVSTRPIRSPSPTR